MRVEEHADAATAVETADVKIITSEGKTLAAHSYALALASPVFEALVAQTQRSSSVKTIKIHGVPSEAVAAFLHLLYLEARELKMFSVEIQEYRDKLKQYGLHLMVLSHVYCVGWLKKACETALVFQVMSENVVDLLQLAVLCDASRLHLLCLRQIAKDFAAVQKTEGWQFLQENDPWLELHILQYLRDSELRKKRRRRKREEKAVYMQLNEAVECLDHICTAGCTDVWPYSRDAKCSSETSNKNSCPNSHTCHGIQLLLRHFATCKLKQATGGCLRCKRMWQLLRLHSSICDEADACNVPLCTKFRLDSKNTEGRRDDEKWKILERKVVAAKVISSLSK